MDDSDQLLRRCQEGDESALAEMVRGYQERIFRLACRVAGDAALAEEVAAEVFVKIWNQCRQWRGQAGAGTWIYRIAVRTILDAQRGRQRWWRRWSAPWLEPFPDHRQGPAEEVAQREQHDRDAGQIHRAIGQLAEADRVLIHLFYFEDRGLAEIEAILGVARATLKMRLARARQRLRTLLEGVDESS